MIYPSTTLQGPPRLGHGNRMTLSLTYFHAGTTLIFISRIFKKNKGVSMPIFKKREANRMQGIENKRVKHDQKIRFRFKRPRLHSGGIENENLTANFNRGDFKDESNTM